MNVEAPSRLPFRLALARVICRWLPPIISMRVRSYVYPQPRAFADDFRFTVRSQTGSLFSGNTSDFHGYRFSVHGFYEWRNVVLARTLCGPGDTILEIGANVGTETVGFRDTVGESGRVFSFEPLPSNVEALQGLVALNDWKNVEIVPVALCARDGVATFTLPPHKHASGMGHLEPGASPGHSKSIEVRCVRLDSLGDRVGAAKAMFCDTEGAETMVLRGAHDYLREHKPAIVLESSPKLLERAGSSLRELHETICDAEYKPFVIDRFGIKPVASLENCGACDWLCLPNEKLECARRCSSAILQCALLPCIAGLNPLCQKPASA